MIESCYWKEELQRIARTIRRVRKPPRWSERAHCIVERDVMIGFFILRRMIELSKVSSATRDQKLKVFSYRALGKIVHRFNAHCIDELYDLDEEVSANKKPAYIANQFVHAYISLVARDASRNWSDIYIVSDYDRNNCIWRVPVSEIHKVFSIAATDYSQITATFDSKKGDYIIQTN